MTPALFFYDLGCRVFPLRARTKEPACKWKDFTCERDAVRWPDYGVVPGDGLAVADTDNAEAERLVAATMPATPFMVRTARGMHRYYRLIGTKKMPIESVPHFIHRAGLVIEFRHGASQYVVGPGSTHASGFKYTVRDWSWKISDVPVLRVDDIEWDDRPREMRGPIAGDPYKFPEVVRTGERHDQLFRLLRSLKALGADRESTWVTVSEACATRCDPPLVVNRTFEQWFDRQWRKPDRPLDRASAADIAGVPASWVRGY